MSKPLVTFAPGPNGSIHVTNAGSFLEPKTLNDLAKRGVNSSGFFVGDKGKMQTLLAENPQLHKAVQAQTHQNKRSHQNQR